MTLDEKQAEWRKKFAIIPDPQERLAAIVNRKPRVESVPEAERIDANLVPGCVSRVWVIGSVEDGRLRVRVRAEAALVAGLAAFLAELYDGSMAAEAADFTPTVLDDLGVGRLLTPTRRHGLEKICERIRAIARDA